jgi:hypothetical protein
LLHLPCLLLGIKDSLKENTRLFDDGRLLDEGRLLDGEGFWMGKAFG